MCVCPLCNAANDHKYYLSDLCDIFIGANATGNEAASSLAAFKESLKESTSIPVPSHVADRLVTCSHSGKTIAVGTLVPDFFFTHRDVPVFAPSDFTFENKLGMLRLVSRLLPVLIYRRWCVWYCK